MPFCYKESLNIMIDLSYLKNRFIKIKQIRKRVRHRTESSASPFCTVSHSFQRDANMVYVAIIHIMSIRRSQSSVKSSIFRVFLFFEALLL